MNLFIFSFASDGRLAEVQFFTARHRIFRYFWLIFVSFYLPSLLKSLKRVEWNCFRFCVKSTWPENFQNCIQYFHQFVLFDLLLILPSVLPQTYLKNFTNHIAILEKVIIFIEFFCLWLKNYFVPSEYCLMMFYLCKTNDRTLIFRLWYWNNVLREFWSFFILFFLQFNDRNSLWNMSIIFD